MLVDFRMEAPQTAEGVLTVFPLTVSRAPGRRSLTLDEALEQGRVEVVESGEVPEVRVDVKGDRPVLVLGGEVLTGGWQNRTVNISLLLEAGKVHRIPVSCVERGRWGPYRFRPLGSPPGAAFEAAASVLPAGLRRVKTRSAVDMLRRRRVARADQAEVWAGVEAYLERTGTEAPTRDVTAWMAQSLSRVEALLKPVEPLEGQVGAVVALGGRVVAVEVLEHPEAWRRLHGKVLRGYALEALEVREPGRPSSDEARAFLETAVRALAEGPVVPAPVGLGEHRLPKAGSGFVQGWALVHEGTLYHLLAFRGEAAS